MNFDATIVVGIKSLYHQYAIISDSLSLLQNMPLFQTICPGCFWARDNRCLLSWVQRLDGPAGGQGPFVPVGGTNPDKKSPFYPGWWLHPGQKAQPFYPGW